MSQLRQTSMYHWTGTSGSETEAKLPTPTLAGKSKLQAISFEDMIAASADYSEEAWLAMKYIDTRSFTSITNARVTKLHGTYQTNHALYAGSTATYTTPKAAGVQSVVSNMDVIPTHIIDDFHGTTAGLSVAYDATDAEYQFIVLQHDITGGTVAAWDPEKQEGNSGYPMIEVAYQLVDRDGGSLIPGGNDKYSNYIQSSVDVYIVINGEMQLFGCTNNEVTGSFGLEWDNLLKGALQGQEDKFLTSRVNELSGNLYSLNPYNWAKFLYGDNLGSSGVSTQIQLNSDWKPVTVDEIILDTWSSYGRRLTVHSTDAKLKINGDITLGTGPAMMPWMIDLGETVNIYLSDDLWDVHRFLVDIELT